MAKETKKIAKPLPPPKPEEKKKGEELSGQEKKEIQVIEQIIENRKIAPADAFGKLTRPQVELIKRTIAKGASDDELRLFVQVCKGAQLNPFMKQAHLVPFWDSKEGIERRAIIVGIDGFRAVAESSGAYAGNDDPIFEGENMMKITVYQDKKPISKDLTVPIKATVTVYKIVEGERYPFTATARWSEYYPGERKGMQWHKMPYLMLGKCAEALALRKTFPKLLSGMYAQEEMDQGLSQDQKAQQEAKAYETITDAIGKMSIEELGKFKEKLVKSEKYTEAQKKEALAKVDARIVELKKPAPNENQKEPEIES